MLPMFPWKNITRVVGSSPAPELLTISQNMFQSQKWRFFFHEWWDSRRGMFLLQSSVYECFLYSLCETRMGNCYREIPGHLLSIGGSCPVLTGWIISHQKEPGTWTCVNGRFWKFFNLACFIIFHCFGQHFKGVQLLFDLCTVFSVAFCNEVNSVWNFDSNPTCAVAGLKRTEQPWRYVGMWPY